MVFFSKKPTPSIEVRNKLLALDLTDQVEKAKELFDIADADILIAVMEYRHFLFLVYYNQEQGNELPVVPTKRADTIWHSHLLFNQDYNEFTQDLFGQILHHKPGLQEGSDPFNTAVHHTKALQDSIGHEGFVLDYFSHVSSSVSDKGSGASKTSSHSSKTDTKRNDTGGCGSAASGCSSNSSQNSSNESSTTGDSSPASCGSASCGGGGCGGGCGG